MTTISRLERIKDILNKGINIDDQGNTELINACLYSDFDTVQYLIAKGANIHIKNNEKMDALHMAVENPGNYKIVEYLIKKGIDVNTF